MKVQIISFHCVLKNKLGQILSTSFNQDVLTADHAPNAHLKGLTQGLQDIQRGEKRRIFVPAAQAYGFYDLNKVRHVPLDDFPDEPKLGETVRLAPDASFYRVTEIRGETVTLDANHPLAGQDLIFEVEATEARPATPEEVWEQMEAPRSVTFH